MHLQYSIRRIGRPYNYSDGGIIINKKIMRAIISYSVTLKTFGEIYKLTPHSCCGVLSSRHLLSLDGNILLSPLLALQTLYALW